MSQTLDVVVVDDDFLVVKVHTRFVESIPGFRVVATAATGQTALDAVHEHDPHLLLLDVHLPDMTGIEVLRRLRADGLDVGVLMVTAAREVEQVRAARSGGAFGYLVKPFGRADLATRLDDFRLELQRLDGVAGEAAAQGDIDAIFAGGSGTSGPIPVLPKGLSADTGELVLGAVREAGDLSASECAARRAVPGDRASLPGALRRDRRARGSPAVRPGGPTRAALPPPFACIAVGSSSAW